MASMWPREFPVFSGRGRSIPLLSMFFVLCVIHQLRGKSWTYIITKHIGHNETKNITITAGEQITVENKTGYEVQFLPSGNSEVYNVASDVCQTTIPTNISTLFSSSEPITWEVTDNARTLKIPPNIVPVKVTVTFCFQVMDIEKDRRLTTIVKVAEATGRSAALSLVVGAPSLVVAMTFVS